MRIFLLLLLSLSFSTAQAHEDLKKQNSTTEELAYLVPKPVERYHVFGIGTLHGDLTSVKATYSYRLGPQLRLNISGFKGSGDIWDQSYGDLSEDNYYENSLNVSSSGIDVSGSYFFRKNGDRKHGVLMTAGMGRTWTNGTLYSKRYGDPGWLGRLFFGDDSRALIEETSEAKSWASSHLSLGVHFQFAWGFHEYASRGHLLQMGVTSKMSNQDINLSLINDSDRLVSAQSEKLSTELEVKYAWAF